MKASKISFFIIVVILGCHTAMQAQLSVTGGDTPAFTPEQLIYDVCLGPGINVLEVTYEGVPAAVGRFSGAGNLIGIEEGFVLTTGFAANASQNTGIDNPAVVNALVPNNSQASHPDIGALANNTIIRDVAVYTIKFVPTGDSILFRYVFASDEYPNYVCTNFNDVFAFYLSGPDANGNTVTNNLAKIPGTDLPVSINSVNSGQIGGFPTADEIWCSAPNGSLDYAALFNVNPGGMPVYNGFTDVFVARSAVIPCQEYTMELVIADIGDAIWDSGLFFEAESFCSFNGESHTTALATLPEGCGAYDFPIDLSIFPENEFPLHFAFSGTATNGLDYSGLPSEGTIEAGDDPWLFALEVLNDGLTEGSEQIILLLEGQNCIQQSYTITLTDPITIGGPASALCSPEPILLEAVADSEILNQFNLSWSTGASAPSILVTPQQTSTYTLVYSNDWASCAASFTVDVEAPVFEWTQSLCSNEEGVVINGTLYDLYNPVGTEILPGGSVAGCDSIIHIQFSPAYFSHLNSTLCAGESVEVNGQIYNASRPDGLEIIVGGAANGCDSVVYIQLDFLDLASSVLNPVLCREDQLLVNGQVYNYDHPQGLEILSGAAANGCDSLLTVDLQFYESYSSAISATIDEGAVYELSGQSFAASGLYELIFTDQNGCDSVLVLDLIINTFTSTPTDSIAIGQTDTLCVNTDIFQELDSFTNVCEGDNTSVAFELDPATGCVIFTGIGAGVDTACIVACDAYGVCDTTILIISVFDNLLDAVDDYDTTLWNQAFVLDVLANDWTESTVITDVYIVSPPTLGFASFGADGLLSYSPALEACLQEDVLTYAICNEMGCDTASVHIWLNEVEGLCDAVWPGDVFNDGLVNQIDYWAIGLGYGEFGPIRPNATIEWTPQPAINWDNTITFIYEFDLKYADCNGNGAVNVEDADVVFLNWGLTHPVLPHAVAFPALEAGVEIRQSAANGEWRYFDLYLDPLSPLVSGLYGASFQVRYDNSRVLDIQFEPDAATLGILDGANPEAMHLQQSDWEAGRFQSVWSRLNRREVLPEGRMGRLKMWCIQGDCGNWALSNQQMVQADGQVFNLKGGATPVINHIEAPVVPLEMALFPNPATHEVQIQLPQAGWVECLNLQGQILQKRWLEAGWQTMSLDALSSGLYLIRLRCADGVLSRKLMVGEGQ
ncbi:MAG TPA: choice-of-anchor L domain-containing protein [Saprospiraceae bacterium]|nr:choice-of-anchor L domain-containing protein [Saprospiraceae bacterium]HMQ82075.1 choice-of-anchor L domain-containing protein [Saprospiraceae bacterium]